MERLPILINSPKKLDSQLSSDPDKTPVSNAANSDSELEDLTQTGEAQSAEVGVAPMWILCLANPCGNVFLYFTGTVLKHFCPACGFPLLKETF